MVDGQPEFAAWSPSRLCFDAVDTVHTDEFTVADRSGRHPQLFASWTVLAAAPGSPPGDVALELYSNSGRLIRAARLAGQIVREARVVVGLVPAEDDNGVPSSEERFQVKMGKTIVTWDGSAARDSNAVAGAGPPELGDDRRARRRRRRGSRALAGLRAGDGGLAQGGWQG